MKCLCKQCSCHNKELYEIYHLLLIDHDIKLCCLISGSFVPQKLCLLSNTILTAGLGSSTQPLSGFQCSLNCKPVMEADIWQNVASTHLLFGLLFPLKNICS